MDQANMASNPRPIRVASDNALTTLAAYELFKEGKLNLKSIPAGVTLEEFSVKFPEASPVTPAAIQTLESQGQRYNPELRKWLVTRSKTSSQQLTNEEAQRVKVEFFTLRAKTDEERKALLDLLPDASSPNKDGENCFVCKKQFKPMSLFLVVNGQRLPLNMPVRIGNYKLAKVNGQGEVAEDGQVAIIPTCRDCSRVVGAESYTYDSATTAIQKAETEKQEMLNVATRAVSLRKTLTRPDGSKRFEGSSAAEDIDATARFLQARREKANFRGGRRDRR